MAKTSIAHRARRVVQRAGIDVRRIAPDEPARRRALLLATHGVTLAIDGGANAGGYGLALREAGYGGRIVSFEPLSAPFARLSEAAHDDPLWECRRLALGDRNEIVEMHVSNEGEVSSTLRPVTSDDGDFGFEYVGTEPVEVVTLDSQAFDAPSIALKLDLEGYEPQALDGAAELLSRVRVVEVELGLREPYKGAAYRDMLDRLEREGFVLAGIEPGFTDWRTGRMLEADALLERAGSGFDRE